MFSEQADEMPTAADRQPLVVLLEDRRWPLVPGVCCWRWGMRSALLTVGASVDEHAVEPIDDPDPTPTPFRQVARLPWLPRPLRSPLVRVYRGGRHLGRRLREFSPRSTQAERAQQQEVKDALRGASLVIAESIGVAEAAVRATDTGDLVWVLALPAERLYSAAPSPYGARLRAMAPKVAGFLTDSESARESVERASATWRTRVEVFPPLAVDATCPVCATPAPLAEAPAGTTEEVVQLGSWRAMLAGRSETDAESEPTQSPYASTWTVPVARPPTDWSVAVQVRAARSVVDPVRLRDPTARPARNTVISGFDLKFIQELAGWLGRAGDIRITLDEWPSLGRPSPRTEKLTQEADTVLAEWARPSAVWLSRRKRSGQFLIVRLHRFELDTHYPRDIDIDHVDAVVHVSKQVGRRIRDELGWPAEKLVHIPNFLDAQWLDRPKLADARFGLGVVGMEWANKRLDLALDLLAAVRQQDPRFSLFVRSVRPWDNTYVWRSPREREYVGWCMERIELDPHLRGAVIFDAPGRDMARWYRRVGHVLSMSDIESFHMAAAEGMASGSVPVIRPWPGAVELYGQRWVHARMDDAVAAVLANADLDTWTAMAKQAQADIRTIADPWTAVDAWTDLLRGDIVGAQRHFSDDTSAD